MPLHGMRECEIYLCITLRVRLSSTMSPGATFALPVVGDTG